MNNMFYLAVRRSVFHNAKAFRVYIINMCVYVSICMCVYIYIYTQKTDTITCRLMYTITYHYLWFFDIAIKSIVEIIDRQITVETSW